MEKEKTPLDSVLSDIQMDHVVFDEITFKRKGFKSEGKGVNFNFATGIEKTSENRYTVTVQVNASKEDEYDLLVRVSGYCTIRDDNPKLDVLLNENVVAILFPYIRAEVSILTAQPETDSLVLPVFNIHELVKNSKPVDNPSDEV